MIASSIAFTLASPVFSTAADIIFIRVLNSSVDSVFSVKNSWAAIVFSSILFIKSIEVFPTDALLDEGLAKDIGCTAFFIIPVNILAASEDILPVDMSLAFAPPKPSSAKFLPSILIITVYSVVYLLSFLDVLLAYQHKLLFPKASYFPILSNYNDALALTKNSSCNNFQENLEKELTEKMFMTVNRNFIF